MNVSVFGLGYVGCVTAACLARDGHQVTGVDISDGKVQMVNEGRSPIVEPGLGDLLAQVVGEGRLLASTSAAEAIDSSDVALICVGTPDSRNGRQDLRALTRVVQDMALACAGRDRPLTVVVRSTVMPGTTEGLIAGTFREQAGAAAQSIRLAMNPEFMREGTSLEDFAHPPFVIAGCDDPATADVLRDLYAAVDAPFLQTSVRTAEMVKYVCNAFHALKICFANEIADLCGPLGADAREVMRIVCEDRKLNISPAYLKPGFAFGGSCLPKDLRALLSTGRQYDMPVPLLGAIVASNEGQKKRGVEAVLATGRRKIGVVGLAFKPATDDLRESPMVTVVEALIGKGCDVRVYDPSVVMARLHGANRAYIENGIPHISALLCDDLDALVTHADVLVIGTPGADAHRARAAARSDQTVIDLTRTFSSSIGTEVPASLWDADPVLNPA